MKWHKLSEVKPKLNENKLFFDLESCIYFVGKLNNEGNIELDVTGFEISSSEYFCWQDLPAEPKWSFK